jgi:hypothetical protein
MNTYQSKEKLMAEQTDAHDFVQSRNKAMQFDREKRQKKIKDNLELHQDTQNTIKGMVDKLTSLNKSADEVELEIKKVIRIFSHNLLLNKISQVPLPLKVMAL